ncbi:hypothetical protein K491DRAFT_714182 [Lophiostoma macrostomum CBS 122681]|uniref:Uncharacterized protein n=1 Tax=Lophiostoma macrostomum CBS 122681 TaxID=1314788 RepID=A0A6A6TEK2_9PLEO|nr:hypothetical protein K491DRAFT_714182 [Lophiostoma macrostomum CBS 122681]
MKLLSTFLIAVLACALNVFGQTPPEELPTIDTFLAGLNRTGSSKHIGDITYPNWARIHNNCPYDVYLWSVDADHNPLTPLHMQPGQWQHEPFRYISDTSGVAYKISRDSTLRGGIGGNHMHFEYAIRDNQIYWDISFVDCAKDATLQGGNADGCVGHERGIRINTAVQGDGYIGVHCLPNTFCLDDAYYISDPDKDWGHKAPVKGCPKGVLTSDMYATLCYDA